MLHLIAAVCQNGGIGKDNDLLCHLSADLKRFKSLTMGHTMIMGRKTFESLPGLLPGRPHWVLTSQAGYGSQHAGVTAFHSLEAILQALDPAEEYYVIGGASLYAAFLPHADSLYLTEIAAALPADTYFPAYDQSQWREVSREEYAADDRNVYAFSFVHYIHK